MKSFDGMGDSSGDKNYKHLDGPNSARHALQRTRGYLPLLLPKSVGYTYIVVNKISV